MKIVNKNLLNSEHEQCEKKLKESTTSSEDLFFRAFITNLGKYNEGELIGDYVDFPIEEEDFDKFLASIGVGKDPDEDGIYYEEWFVTDYDTNTNISLGEYPSFEELNEIGEIVDEINRNGDQQTFSNAMEYCNGEPSEIAQAVIDGDILFYQGVRTDSDLGWEIIEQIGSLKDALGDRITDYIDEDFMRRAYEDDIRNIMRDDAKSQLSYELNIDEDEVKESDIEDWIDDNFDAYMDSVINDELDAAERGEVDLSDYFDYEAFGRDCRFDGGFYFTSDGCIEDRR